MFIDELKESIVKNANSLLGEGSFSLADFVYPPDVKMGDISLPCFRVAKKLGRRAGDLAADLVANLSKGEFIASLSAAGPYLNIKFKTEVLADKILSVIEETGNKYGTNFLGDKKRIMIEYSNGNTHKEYHVGHLRNISYGDAVFRILQANGFNVIPVSYVNDFGIHVAKTLWGYLELFKDVKLPEDKGAFLGEIYAKAVEEMEVSRTGKQMVQMIMKKIEAREGEEYHLWEKTRQWSIAQYDKIYSELGVKFKKIYYESDMIEEGKKIVQQLLDRGILKKSQGAVIADLEQYGLGVLVVLRSNQTAAYPVADIPLAMKKVKEFELDKSIYVVDKRQALYFRQLFKILELAGYKQEFVHLDYDFVDLPSGMMSSRSGNVITYENLRRELYKKIREETLKRRSDWTDEKVNKTVEILAVATMKFEMIKVDRKQIITFYYKKALNFQGYTAAYIQYAFARLSSIIRKAGEDIEERSEILLKEGIEHQLLMKLLKFPECVVLAGREYDPSEIAKYIYSLAQMSNDYYHKVNILKASEPVRSSRLRLLAVIRQVMTNAFFLLGIETLDEM